MAESEQTYVGATIWGIENAARLERCPGWQQVVARDTYRDQVQCPECGRRFNKRSGTAFAPVPPHKRMRGES